MACLAEADSKTIKTRFRFGSLGVKSQEMFYSVLTATINITRITVGDIVILGAGWKADYV